jgi:Cof subfamily protein (haloacid dehalogenase superfamily)
VQAFACDLDGTLIGRDGILGRRTRAAITRSKEEGVRFLVATGRMFRSARRYLDEAGLDDPVVCYQGAAVVDPRSGEFLLHEPLDLEVAREVIGSLAARGLSPNVYVDDQLYVASETEYSRRYSAFQHLPVVEVGSEPDVLADVRAELAPRFDGRLFLTTSLPYMLELGNPGVTKGSGLAFVASALGIDLERVVAFGDGENDVELLEVAGLGVAVEGGHPRLLAIADRTCAGPEDEGVAGVIEAVLDSAA